MWFIHSARHCNVNQVQTYPQSWDGNTPRMLLVRKSLWTGDVMRWDGMGWDGVGCDMMYCVTWCDVMCDVMWCIAWCDVMCYVMWCDVIWYGVMCDVMCDVICDDVTVWCDVMWCDWCDVMWCDYRFLIRHSLIVIHTKSSIVIDYLRDYWRHKS